MKIFLITILTTISFSNLFAAGLVCTTKDATLLIQEGHSGEILATYMQMNQGQERPDILEFEGSLIDVHGNGLYEIEVFKLKSSLQIATLSVTTSTILTRAPSNKPGPVCRTRDCPVRAPKNGSSVEISAELTIGSQTLYLDCGRS